MASSTRLKVRCVFLKYSVMFFMLMGATSILGAIGAITGLATWPLYIAYPLYFLVACPALAFAERMGNEQAKKLEEREKENVLEKLARL
jgi:hypothetical protein